MKLLIVYLGIIGFVSISCVSNKNKGLSNSSIEYKMDSVYDISLAMSLDDIKSVCKKMEKYRDQLQGIEDPNVFNEINLSKSVGGYSYQNLLYIVRRYGREIGNDLTYEKCEKYLYLFNDGEYAGAINRVLPSTKSKYADKTQAWLLSS